MGIHTILLGAQNDGMRPRPIPDGGAGQHPDLVLCPALQLVQYNAGHIEGHGGGLVVFATHLHEEHLIVYDPAVRSLDGRRQPAEGYGRRAGGYGGDISRRSTWY